MTFNNSLSQQIFVASDSEDAKLISSYLSRRVDPCDSLLLTAYANETLVDLYDDGYLFAAFDIKRAETCYIANWKVGSKYQWANLDKGNIPEVLLSKIGYRQRFYQNKVFSLKELNKLLEKIIGESENAGYPFASVNLEAVRIEEQRINASLNYNPGPEILFDELNVRGTNKVKPTWLAAYLNVKEGQSFNQLALDNIQQKVDQLSFVRLTEPPVTSFQNSRAEVTLALEDVSANSIDGIIGFLPNEEEEGRILITGQLNLRLNNLFNSGKRLALDWQSIKPRSQLLDIQYAHPNIGRSQFGLLAGFKLLKEDTFFINRNAVLEATYNKGRSVLSMVYNSVSSSNLLVNNDEEINDLSLNSFGLKWRFNNLAFTNKSGRYFELTGTIGSKQLESNSSNDDGFETNTTQYVVQGNFKNKQRLASRWSLYNELHGGQIFNEAIFRNDMFRLGGLSTLRGFNDNFFFVSQYLLIRSEVQFYFQKQSYFFLFYDRSFNRYESTKRTEDDQPFGFGLGAAIEMKSGILNMAYAIGEAKDQPLDTRLSKFHFGYILRF